MARERCLRDRNSQLLAPGKSFKRVLDVLAAVQVPLPSRASPHATFLNPQAKTRQELQARAGDLLAAGHVRTRLAQARMHGPRTLNL